MDYKVKDVTAVIEEFAPLSIQESWDNSGLCIGSPEAGVSSVLLGLDCTPELVDEAVACGADMIVTHHPLIFSGLKSISPEDPVGEAVIKAVKAGISIYAAHTNADKVIAGVSGAMAQRLGLKNVRILDEDGEGTGLGVVGDFPVPLSAEDAVRLVKERFSLKAVRASRPLEGMIERVAMCGGSGGSLIKAARKSGAQLYISGDISYHNFFAGDDFMIMDIGHYESEIEIVDILFLSDMAKKTKKFETPIDQRETFVSIQKSFADSDLSVSEKLQTLYALQQADTAIDKILQLRGELPMEVEALETEIAELKAKAARIAEMVDEYNKFIAQNKLGITECDAQIEKYKSQIDNVANSREYDSLNKEIENQGLLRQIAEKHIAETKERIFDKKNELEVVKEKIAVRSEDLKAKQEELATIVESTSKEEEKLRANRDACAAKIDERTMSAYDHIRQSCNNRLAVVSVFNGDSCGGCFNTIAPQRLIDIASNRKMIVCEYCGRILVNPDFE